jgi:hypothetical protein
VTYALETTAAGQLGLTVIGINNEISAVLGAMLTRGKDETELDAAIYTLRGAWPRTYPGSMDTDYPHPSAPLDTWARAAMCHAIIDRVSRREMGSRRPPVSGDRIAAVYSGFYLITSAMWTERA